MGWGTYLLGGRGRLVSEGQFDGLGSSSISLFVQSLLTVRLRQNHKEMVAFLTFHKPCRRWKKKENPKKVKSSNSNSNRANLTFRSRDNGQKKTPFVGDLHTKGLNLGVGDLHRKVSTCVLVTYIERSRHVCW